MNRPFFTPVPTLIFSRTVITYVGFLEREKTLNKTKLQQKDQNRVEDVRLFPFQEFLQGLSHRKAQK